MDIFIDAQFEHDYRESPILLADVGARGGLKQNWLPARRHLRVLGFEPDADEYRRLVAQPAGDVPQTFFNVALHNQRGPITLHIARDAGLSSIFEPNRQFVDGFPDAARFDTVRQVTMPGDTLDAIVATHKTGGVDFLKVDTQGSELYVLQGATKTLTESILGVEVEIEFAPIYTGQPLFSDVDAFMRGLGFALFDLRPCYWKREAGRDAGGPYGQIIWGDALYLKDLPALHAGAAGLSPIERRRRLLKAISIDLLYGYADYALETVRTSESAWTGKERGIIERALRTPADGKSRRTVPGRKRVTAALRRIEERLREPADGWSVSDPGLGNVS